MEIFSFRPNILVDGHESLHRLWRTGKRKGQPSCIPRRIRKDTASVDNLNVHDFLLPLVIEEYHFPDSGIEDHSPTHKTGHPATGFFLLVTEDVKRCVIHQIKAGADDGIGLGMNRMTDLVVFTAGDMEAVPNALPPLQAAPDARSSTVVACADDRMAFNEDCPELGS
jgi:hypothetical protein